MSYVCHIRACSLLEARYTSCTVLYLPLTLEDQPKTRCFLLWVRLQHRLMSVCLYSVCCGSAFCLPTGCFAAYACHGRAVRHLSLNIDRHSQIQGQNPAESTKSINWGFERISLMLHKIRWRMQPSATPPAMCLSR